MPISEPRPLLRASGALAALVLVAVPALARADGDSTIVLKSGPASIYNLAGKVTVEPSDGSSLKVIVTREGDDARELRIATGVIDGRQTLRVIYPDNRIVYPEMGSHSRTQMRVRSDGTFGGKNHSGGSQVTIAGSGNGLEAHADLRVLVPRNQDVAIRLGVGEATASKVSGSLDIDTGSGNVTAQSTLGSLAIDTGSGDVRVDGATGEVSLDTGSGDVVVKNVKGGPLSIDTGSGDVTASDIEVPELMSDTGSGTVTFERLRSPRVKLETGSGDIEAELLAPIDAVTIETGSGEVTLRVPKDAGAKIALETGSGGLDVDMPVTMLHREQGELRAQIGDGRGRIDVETGSGGIRIATR